MSQAPPSDARRRLGPYALERELARGASGVVYQACDPQGAPVAIKLLEARTEAGRQRFLREMRVLTRLRHPQVVRILDAGEDQGRLWLAMELVEGRTLDGRLEAEGPLALGEAVELVRALCRGVSHAHGLGVLHRDLKPQNVLLRADGSPLVADFGLAKDLGSESALSVSGALLGTPGYWAPEQVHGRLAPDARTDVYGLGATLYACLTGRPPVAVGSLQEALEATLHTTPTPPAELRPDVDQVLSAIVLRALEKDPARRQADPAALEAELGRWSPQEAGGLRQGPLALGGVLLFVVGLSIGAATWLAPDQAGADGAPEGPPAGQESGSHLADVPADPLPGPSASIDSALASSPGRDALRRALALSQAGDRPGAEAACGEALRLDPTLQPALELRMELRYTRRAWQDLLGDAEQLLAAWPQSARAHFLRANALYHLERTEEALPAYRQAIALGDPYAQQNLASALHSLGRLDEALAEARRASELLPEAWQPHMLVARSLHAKGDRLLAIVELERAVHKGAQDEDCLQRASEVGSQLEAWPLVREVAERHVALAPRDPRGWDHRGVARRRLGDLEGAVADHLRALELAPREPALWRTLGHARHAQRRKQEALEAYTRGVACARPGSREEGELRHMRGSLLHELGDLAAARVELERAAALLPAGDRRGDHARELLEQLPR